MTTENSCYIYSSRNTHGRILKAVIIFATLEIRATLNGKIQQSLKAKACRSRKWPMRLREQGNENERMQ